jgi:hypothetical protein
MRRFALQLSRIKHLASATIRCVPLGALGLLLLPLAAIATPSEAADLWRTAHARPIVYAPPAVYGPAEPLCYWCIRDAIYADTKLIAHLEANPDVDEADKAPWILGARADVHRLRRILGSVETVSVAPCCYSRKRLYVR